MKKIYSLFMIALTTFSYGQFSENFDAGLTIPAGWTSFRGTNGLGTAFDWTFIASTRANSGANVAFVRYEAGTGGVNEDWLVTPLINLTNYTNASLRFYANQQYTAAYGTVYEILVSTTSQTSISSFTSEATFAESDFLLTTTPMAAADLKTVSLSAYSGQQIYIAFKMSQDDGDNWFLDTVSVTGTLSNITFDSQNKTVYPNPTTGLVTIESNDAIESVKVIGMLGNVLKTYSNTNSIDLSDLSSGNYLVNIITTNGETTTKKIVKN